MEDNWPPELLDIRNKFTNNAKREIEELKSLHADELKQLKDEHSRSVSRIIERHQQEMNKITTDRDVQIENCESSTDKAVLIRERYLHIPKSFFSERKKFRLIYFIYNIQGHSFENLRHP